MKKTQISLLLLMLSFLSTLNVFASEGPETSCKAWLATQTAVQTRGGDTYDLSKVDAHEAFLGSNRVINGGIPDFLKGDLQKDAGASASAKIVGKRLAHLLSRENRSLESITFEDFPNQKNITTSLKETLNFIINHFLWDNGVQKITEVTLEEVAAASCMRHRLIDHKKSLG
jgi:hypothetical protein